MFRCELCDDFLPILQLGRLCKICYKIRGIIKCYSTEKIHDAIATIFLITIDNSNSTNMNPKNETEMGDSSYMEKPTYKIKDKSTESYAKIASKEK
jgi:hypothetical protein